MNVVKGKVHIVGPVCNCSASFLFHINQTNNFRERAITKFALEKFMVKVLDEVKGKGHTIDPIIISCTSFLFHMIWTNHSGDMSQHVISIYDSHMYNLDTLQQYLIYKLHVASLFV